MRRTLFPAVWAMAMMASACGGDESGGSGGNPATSNPTGVSFSEVQAVLDEHCATCHYGNELQFGVPDTREQLLTETTSCVVGDEVVERPVVTPGDLENSTLWHKTANVDLSCGREMPPTGQGGLAEVDPEAFAILEAWILEGAPE